jgi:NAD(P)-dependent dehydrogenase (short-subunit alcohol dehydrogenase family)
MACVPFTSVERSTPFELEISSQPYPFSRQQSPYNDLPRANGRSVMPLPIEPIAGKIILLTGASRGIGLAAARELQKRGAKVVAGARDPARMPADLRVSVLKLDTSDAQSCRDFVKRAEEEHGRIDGLINNAGILLDRDTPALALGEDALRQVIEVNLIGPFRLCQLVLPGMVKRGYGRIVNISSGLGSITDMSSGYVSYRMTKLALNGLTRVLAAELGTYRNIKINSLSPGWTRTDMGGAGASREPEDPAREIADLISISADGPSGGFFYEGKPAAW